MGGKGKLETYFSEFCAQTPQLLPTDRGIGIVVKTLQFRPYLSRFQVADTTQSLNVRVWSLGRCPAITALCHMRAEMQQYFLHRMTLGGSSPEQTDAHK